MRLSSLLLLLLLLLGGWCTAAVSEAAEPDWQSLLRQSEPAKLAVLLEGGLDPNLRLPDQSLPLAWAVELHATDSVRVLLEHGAMTEDPRPGANPFQPLIVACQHGNEDILRVLLEAGADVNVTGPEDIPALSICAGHSPPGVVAQMLTLGATVDRTDANGQTPLMWAARHARAETVDLLIERGAEVNKTTSAGFTPLLFAVKSGDSSIARALVEAGGDTGHTTPDGTTLIQLAMYQENYEFAEWLIETTADFENSPDLEAYDLNGRQLIHAAVLANQPRLVALLLAQGADVHALTTPSSIKWKYESNFRPGAYEFPPTPPLALAAQQNAPSLMQALADAGADANWRDAEGNNIVLLAARQSPETLEMALALAPDVDVQNNSGQTPLHVVLRGFAGPETDARLQLLASHGADPEIADKDGITAAEMAAAEDFRAGPLFASLFNKTNLQEPGI